MNETRQWRVFYTLSRAEKKCEERLAASRIEVFLPKRTVLRQWKDRKKEVVEPLFRNYLFARVNERERLAVLQTQGIVCCVAFSGAPAALSEEEIEQIRIAQREERRLAVVEYVPRLQQGEQVVVVEGPLRGLKGEVDAWRGETHLVIHIPAIRQSLRISVPAAWTRVLQPHKHAA